ncbi:hypothetical protein HMPREF1210_00156 [Paenisporosarcina sp. HGH0030]|nr:hypothetical protein HMPREF1210_00156 [Paenisporosarcina sp. HGH0030]
MSLLGFMTLFIAFSYENKLLRASKIKQQLLHPYALSLDEIIQCMSEYKLYITRDFLINIIYWIFVIVSSVLIITWGTIIGFYSNFDFPSSFEIKNVQVINTILVVIWVLFSFLLISISIILNLIRFNKDPLGKGYLLNEIKMSDIESIIKNKGDIQELFFKISPSLSLIKNPPNDSQERELSIYFPLKLSNIRFVAILYKQDSKETSLRIFGVLKDLGRVGESFSHIITQTSFKNSPINEQSVGILKFYDKNNNLISLLKLKAEKNDDGLIVKVKNKMDLKLITKDNDYKDIENHDKEFIDYTLS